MNFTDAQAWLEAHELIECKPLKGRWTRQTCLAISGKDGTILNKRSAHRGRFRARSLPCANCPILAALEKI